MLLDAPSTPSTPLPTHPHILLDTYSQLVMTTKRTIMENEHMQPLNHTYIHVFVHTQLCHILA